MPQPRGARLLVVDDNADNREVLGRRLQRLGHSDISYAADGIEAHEMLAAQSLTGQSFDAVLLDVMMPRMGGVELLELMRSEGRLEATPVIMISAATETDIVVRCIELGAEDYLPKPFNPTLLRARLGSVLEKRGLRAQLRAQLALLERDLAQARTQQLSMVPTEFPGGPGHGYVIYAAMHPAREVGGDLYDCVELGQGKLLIAVGDVSGKGMPAALFMARARSSLRALALQQVELTGRIPTPAEIARVVNHELCRSNAACLFVTMFIGIIDVASGDLAFVNAGHVRPLRVGADGVVGEIACPADLPMGIMEGVAHRTTTLRLARGETLVVISDGLPEMIDPADAFYGAARVCADITELAAGSPESLITELCARVLRFADTADQADDVTALAIRLT